MPDRPGEQDGRRRMIAPETLLQSYARRLRLLTEARGVTLFLPGMRDEGGGVLVHEGSEPPLPELADRAAADDFAQRAEIELARDLVRQPGAAWQLPSGAAGSRLVRIPSLESLFVSLGNGDSADHRRRRTDRQQSWPLGRAWIGLRFAGEPRDLPPIDVPLSLPGSLEDPAQRVEPWGWVLAFGAALVWHNHLMAETLRDPVSGLPGRVELQSVLDHLLTRARTTQRPLTLFFLNPDGFVAVNDHLGREAGDQLVREIAELLRAQHRSGDFVARYGGVVFASVLIDTPLGDGRRVAEKVRRGLSQARLSEGFSLAFSAGVASYDPAGPEPGAVPELMRAADSALGLAKREGGARTACWEPGMRAVVPVGQDRLHGIFTAELSRDYRNMALLLDTLRSVAGSDDASKLLHDALAAIAANFELARAGVFRAAEGGSPQMVYGLVAGPPETRSLASGSWHLSPRQRTLVERSCGRGEAAAEDPRPRDRRKAAVALPMTAGSRRLGCLFLEGRGERRYDRGDLHFLGVLANQLAVALDRAELAERERVRQRDEAGRMRAELENLRSALDTAELVYRSPEMEALLALARRVAPTDATVLIAGESGTGKEMLARTIHELSPRRNGPQVVVDCTSIPDNLVESELFGHQKGAFTGADRPKRGRLLDADGGTVLLDEISELPLGVQAKLLRFVQERQFLPVGGTRPIKIDVRILAATNRDLAADVQAGRFREDLYHRLNVFTLLLPPLRERPDDILYLARYFLTRYARMYAKEVKGLAPDAEEALLAYPWPGNVRELQHRVMRAVILCDGAVLRAPDLVFAEEGVAGSRAGALGARGGGPASPALSEGARALLEPPLEALLRRVARGSGPLPPVGTWLHDELLRQAEARSGGVGRRAAALLGLAETSYRRQLPAALRRADAVPAAWAKPWDEVVQALGELLDRAVPGTVDLGAACEELLLRLLHDLGLTDTSSGASLLGVSRPTFRRRLEQRSR
jgi:diguanylate cyclase (GGDEF)-like protein